MSEWVRARGTLKFMDPVPDRESPDLNELMGRECGLDDAPMVWIKGDGYTCLHPGYMPLGYEGSLKRHTEKSSDEEGRPVYEIGIEGDLRCCYDKNEIGKWFIDICGQLLCRGYVILEADIESTCTCDSDVFWDRTSRWHLEDGVIKKDDFSRLWQEPQRLWK